MSASLYARIIRAAGFPMVSLKISQVRPADLQGLPHVPKPSTVYTDGIVRVRCVAPKTPSRRIQAVIKAKLSAQALRSALERAEASYEAAYGKLKGPEITKFTHLTNGS